MGKKKSNNAKVVFRIEIATLIDEKEELDLKRMERLAMLITNLNNSGIHPLLVSSGAIMLGSKKLHMLKLPGLLKDLQAIAAIGQAELIKYYQQCFAIFHQMVAQILLTSDVIKNPERNRNAKNTFFHLLDKNIIPIINENDSVSTDDIELDDNYPLARNVASVVNAELIILKSTKNVKYLLLQKNNPRKDMIIKEESLIDEVHDLLKQKGHNAKLKSTSYPKSIKNIDF